MHVIADITRMSPIAERQRTFTVFAGVLLCACNVSAGNTLGAPGSKQAFELSRVALIGRFDLTDPHAPRMSWPASHIKADFNGSLLKVTLTDTPIEDETRETDWIDVVIDERPPRALQLREGRNTYTLASDLRDGPHRVTLWKRTEPEVGVITFHGLHVAPGRTITKPAAAARRLEVVGDSISAGFGSLGQSERCRWSADTESSYVSYGAVAARALKADFTDIAWSGKGVLRNYDPREPLTLPMLYARVIPTEDSSPLSVVSAADAPHVFVVNLGTNDMFSGVSDQAAFTTEMTNLLHMLRSRGPQALIVLAIGPMLNDSAPRPMARSLMRSWLAQVEADWRSGVDQNIATIEFWTKSAEGFGCSFHPNERTHARMGAELAALIRARLKW